MRWLSPPKYTILLSTTDGFTSDFVSSGQTDSIALRFCSLSHQAYISVVKNSEWLKKSLI